MHYKIYIPGCRGYSPEHLQRVGLGELLDAHCPVSAVDVLQGGPDKGQGVVFSWEGDPDPGYHANRQMWTPCKPRGELAGGRFWMGQTLNDSPRPEDLLRSNHLGGEPAELADGRRWLIPVARQLPHRFALGDDGMPRRQVRAEYEQFFARAQEYFRLFVSWYEQNGRGDLEVPAGWTFAVDALRMNYRVNADITDWLGLLDDRSVVELIGATHEWRTFTDMAQKKN